jgi:hypothetical protein
MTPVPFQRGLSTDKPSYTFWDAGGGAAGREVDSRLSMDGKCETTHARLFLHPPWNWLMGNKCIHRQRWLCKAHESTLGLL